MTKWVYSFGKSGTDGESSMRDLLGGKGANLAEMSNIGLPVPPGFTISTDVCSYFYDNHHRYPDALDTEVRAAIAKIEVETLRNFASPDNPLLVSVRSGARASMPGMMDTILNLGLNDITVSGLAKHSIDTRFAYDSYRRFIQMYSDVVMNIDHGLFEDALEDMKREKGFLEDTDLTGYDMVTLVEQYKAIVLEEAEVPFPQDPWEQLWGAIGAVFASWMNTRAATYRRLNDIPTKWGTAVNVQAMVFGNMGNDCATGVAFTRDPANGEDSFYGEFLINAQGEDVVAGIRTPLPLTRAAREKSGGTHKSMQEAMPGVFFQLESVRVQLEAHYRDMQDLEFTVQQGALYILQTRSGKRTAEAALRIAVEMAEENLISRDEAICRLDSNALDQLLHPTLDPNAKKTCLTRGLPASPGAACGRIVLSSDKAEEMAAAGETVILVRLETSPEDIHGMHAAAGILTARGGMTSHAAVVARGMGRACVSGAGDVRFDETSGKIFIQDHILLEGDLITIDGANGEVYAGAVATIHPKMSSSFGTIMAWADKRRRLGVRANAETPADAKAALSFGAEGIGLCRTEHMFFDADRIIVMRQMIMASDTEGREAALAKLLPMQRKDFESLFTIMEGLPVTIRLLDPPLHEFLPHSPEELAEIAKVSGVTLPSLEIMVPLATTGREIALCKAEIDKAAKVVTAETGITVNYVVGTMIELPRASICAADLAKEAEFFSFGTNDLTQTTLGISRDDAGSFLHHYASAEIYPTDPFVSIDLEGVGFLVEMGVAHGRSTRPDIKMGICGEHGGDPRSIAFFEKVGLDYISCSPFRVPAARLAAAQAVIKLEK